MMKWVGFDRLTVVLLSLGVRYIEGIRSWFTNEFNVPTSERHEWMAWSTAPGENFDKLLTLFQRVIVNLGVNLQHQRNADAYCLIPALELLQSLDRLSTFGR